METPVKICTVRYFLTIFLTVFHCFIFAQTNPKENGGKRLGINYGLGTQQKFPFNLNSYTYDVEFIKLNYSQNLTRNKNLNIALSIEPGIYFSKVSETDTFTFGENNNDMTAKLKHSVSEKTINRSNEMNEYVLNVGLQMIYSINENLSPYLLGSVGPMVIDKQTKRQKKGFAFSDIFAIGLLYRTNDIILDLRFGIRHVSNAGFGHPNKGYNSSNFEIGLSLPIQKPER